MRHNPVMVKMIAKVRQRVGDGARRVKEVAKRRSGQERDTIKSNHISISASASEHPPKSSSVEANSIPGTRRKTSGIEPEEYVQVSESELKKSKERNSNGRVRSKLARAREEFRQSSNSESKTSKKRRLNSSIGMKDNSVKETEESKLDSNSLCIENDPFRRSYITSSPEVRFNSSSGKKAIKLKRSSRSRISSSEPEMSSSMSYECISAHESDQVKAELNSASNESVASKRQSKSKYKSELNTESTRQTFHSNTKKISKSSVKINKHSSSKVMKLKKSKKNNRDTPLNTIQANSDQLNSTHLKSPSNDIDSLWNLSNEVDSQSNSRINESMDESNWNPIILGTESMWNTGNMTEDKLSNVEESSIQSPDSMLPQLGTDNKSKKPMTPLSVPNIPLTDNDSVIPHSSSPINDLMNTSNSQPTQIIQSNAHVATQNSKKSRISQGKIINDADITDKSDFYVCDECSKAYSTKSSVNRHKRKSHLRQPLSEIIPSKKTKLDHETTTDIELEVSAGPSGKNINLEHDQSEHATETIVEDVARPLRKNTMLKDDQSERATDLLEDLTGSSEKKINDQKEEPDNDIELNIGDILNQRDRSENATEISWKDLAGSTEKTINVLREHASEPNNHKDNGSNICKVLKRQRDKSENATEADLMDLARPAVTKNKLEHDQSKDTTEAELKDLAGQEHDKSENSPEPELKNMYVCEECSKAYTTCSSLKRHKRKVHLGQSSPEVIQTKIIKVEHDNRENATENGSKGAVETSVKNIELEHDQSESATKTSNDNTTETNNDEISNKQNDQSEDALGVLITATIERIQNENNHASNTELGILIAAEIKKILLENDLRKNATQSNISNDTEYYNESVINDTNSEMSHIRIEMIHSISEDVSDPNLVNGHNENDTEPIINDISKMGLTLGCIEIENASESNDSENSIKKSNLESDRSEKGTDPVTGMSSIGRTNCEHDHIDNGTDLVNDQISIKRISAELNNDQLQANDDWIPEIVSTISMRNAEDESSATDNPVSSDNNDDLASTGLTYLQQVSERWSNPDGTAEVTLSMSSLIGNDLSMSSLKGNDQSMSSLLVASLKMEIDIEEWNGITI